MIIYVEPVIAEPKQNIVYVCSNNVNPFIDYQYVEAGELPEEKIDV